MRSRLLWASVVAAGVVALASRGGVRLALADTPSAGSAAPATSAAPAGTVTAAGSAAPSATAPPRPATGYGWSNHAPAGGARPAAARPVGRTAAAHPAPTGPVATLPGFEMEADGSSRLFVQLTQSVAIEERVAKGQITYVLKGAHVTVHNNQNPLETVHFNTPVVRARLVPSGGDLLFVIELRAAATPTWKLVAAKDGSSILNVDFPKGAWLGAPAPPPASPPPAPPPSAPAPRAGASTPPKR